MHSAQYRVSINFLLDIEALVDNFYPQENSLICQQLTIYSSCHL